MYGEKSSYLPIFLRSPGIMLSWFTSLQSPAAGGFSALLTILLLADAHPFLHPNYSPLATTFPPPSSFQHPKQLYHHYFREQILLKLQFNRRGLQLTKRNIPLSITHCCSWSFSVFHRRFLLAVFFCGVVLFCFYPSCQQFPMLLFPPRLFLSFFSLLPVCQGSFPPTTQKKLTFPQFYYTQQFNTLDSIFSSRSFQEA